MLYLCVFFSAVALEYPHAVLLDPRSGSFCHELRAHKTALYCVRWSPICEHLLATGGLDSKILLWDIRSAKGYLSSLDQHNGEAKGNQKDLITAHNGVVNSLCFTDDGLHLVSFGTDSKVRLWDVALSLNTLVNYGVIPNNYQRQQCTLEICCNTNPPLIFVPSSKRIYALDLYSGTRILTLLAHFRAVNCCAYRSSTNQLYSGGNDMNILLWTPDLEQETAEKSESKKSGARTTTLADSEDAWSSSGSDNDT